jgi:hypothetical protein
MHEHQEMKEVKECVAESLSQMYLRGTLHRKYFSDAQVVRCLKRTYSGIPST